MVTRIKLKSKILSPETNIRIKKHLPGTKSDKQFTSCLLFRLMNFWGRFLFRVSIFWFQIVRNKSFYAIVFIFFLGSSHRFSIGEEILPYFNLGWGNLFLYFSLKVYTKFQPPTIYMGLVKKLVWWRMVLIPSLVLSFEMSTEIIVRVNNN